jgi:hypothetical protein
MEKLGKENVTEARGKEYFRTDGQWNQSVIITPGLKVSEKKAKSDINNFKYISI